MKTSTYDETRWKLVPVESTQRMKDAGGSAALLACGTWRDVAKGAYSAMLAATPPAAEQAQQGADKLDAVLQLIDEFRERLPSSFLTLVDAARAGKGE